MHVATRPWFPDRSQKYWGNHSWVHSESECRHPEHDLPKHMVFPNGEYKHRCPGCGSETTVFVERPTW